MADPSITAVDSGSSVQYRRVERGGDSDAVVDAPKIEGMLGSRRLALEKGDKTTADTIESVLKQKLGVRMSDKDKVWWVAAAAGAIKTGARVSTGKGAAAASVDKGEKRVGARASTDRSQTNQRRNSDRVAASSSRRKQQKQSAAVEGTPLVVSLQKSSGKSTRRVVAKPPPECTDTNVVVSLADGRQFGLSDGGLGLLGNGSSTRSSSSGRRTMSRQLLPGAIAPTDSAWHR